MTALVQFAFFGPGRSEGTVDFAHPFLADYLAARYAVSMLRKQCEASRRAKHVNPVPAVRQAIGTVEVKPGSIFHRYFVRELQRDKELRAFLQAAHDRGGLQRENVVEFVRLVVEG